MPEKTLMWHTFYTLPKDGTPGLTVKEGKMCQCGLVHEVKSSCEWARQIIDDGDECDHEDMHSIYECDHDDCHEDCHEECHAYDDCPNEDKAEEAVNEREEFREALTQIETIVTQHV